jgi:hypothetical protein
MSDSDDEFHSAEDMEAEMEANRKREAVLSYWAALKKDDKTLNRFSLGYLEHKILSWSVQDIFNKNLFRQQVKYHWWSLISPCLLASCTHVSPFVCLEFQTMVPHIFRFRT